MTRGIPGVIKDGYSLRKLNTEPFKFLEGPVWEPNRRMLYFSDIEGTTTFAMDQDGALTEFRNETAHANGMALTPWGTLAQCQMSTGNIVEIDLDSGRVVSTLAESYDGKRYNAPNDIAFDEHGGAYFTDPYFHPGDLVQSVEAVYYRDITGQVERVAEDPVKPNGLALSGDGRRLFVDDTHNVEVWAYPVVGKGKLDKGSVFCRLEPPPSPDDLPEVQKNGEADGMALDSAGNLYVTTYTGVQVFDKHGSPLGSISMPADESPANCAFGGPDMTTLFLTARTSLYSVNLEVAGLGLPPVQRGGSS